MARPLLTLLLAAVALMLPSLVWGTLPSHSSLHNLTWAAQFSEQVLSGVLYPRWLPESFVAPAGRHGWRLDRQTLPAERWGWIAAAVASMALLLSVTWRPAAAGIRRHS